MIDTRLFGTIDVARTCLRLLKHVEVSLLCDLEDKHSLVSEDRIACMSAAHSKVDWCAVIVAVVGQVWL